VNALAPDALRRCRVNMRAALIDADEARANLTRMVQDSTCPTEWCPARS